MRTLFPLPLALALPQILNPLTDLLSNLLIIGSGSGLASTPLPGRALAGAAAGAVTQTFDTSSSAGGTAGNTVGVRLAEAGHAVAIIEAGGGAGQGNPVVLRPVGRAARRRQLVVGEHAAALQEERHLPRARRRQARRQRHGVLRDPPYAARRLADYVAARTGELASNAVEFLGWEKLSRAVPGYVDRFSEGTKSALARFPEDWPEAEWLTVNAYIENFLHPVADVAAQTRQHATILGALVAPTSRGNVTLASASAGDAPFINPNWLTTASDVELAVAMYRRMREMWATSAMQTVVVGDECYPGTDAVATDEEIHAHIKKSLKTVWHAACTCKVGREDDEGAVLDARVRVYGVKGLRVVDASNFPTLPPGHPQSTVCMCFPSPPALC
ncbi:Choline dehydrogenase [Diplodia seriata]|uniref:Choline dehydrogenase n=1 Tax=Diplodia seriata TaxID=420778 RepID=A0A1S8BBI7_9PEZI|nr:Choline dehydrogenase [Diplodia seriata]